MKRISTQWISQRLIDSGDIYSMKKPMIGFSVCFLLLIIYNLIRATDVLEYLEMPLHSIFSMGVSVFFTFWLTQRFVDIMC